MAESLNDGDNLYLDCPGCGRKNKFSICLKDGVVLYNCFRPSCKYHSGGAMPHSGTRGLVHTRLQPRKQRARPFNYALEPLSKEWEAYLEQAIGWTAEHRQIGRPLYAPEVHRIAFPIFNPMGRRHGWSLRSYSGDEPKALTRPDEGATSHISWYRRFPLDPKVVVVEDIPSAVRVSLYTNAAALCGTGCSIDYATELAAHARQAVWALDADAVTTSIRYMKRYALMFDRSVVLPITQDFKDMTEQEIKEVLGG